MLQADEVRNGGDLRQWRKERGWNQSRVAMMLMSSQKTISNLEAKPFEPLPPKFLHSLRMTENPAEARILGQWQHLFGQVLDHMKANAMLPETMPAASMTGLATRLTRHLQDELIREGVPMTYA